MTTDPIRFFADDTAVRRVGEGLLARTLPKSEWTHEAHLAGCTWLLVERPDIDPDRELRSIITGYNESVGGVNDETQGYHHTITMTFLAGVRDFLARSEPGGHWPRRSTRCSPRPRGTATGRGRIIRATGCSRSPPGWGMSRRIALPSIAG